MSRPDDEPGVSLASLRAIEGCQVLLLCRCGKSRTVPLETAIAVAGEAAGIRTVWRSARRPCACGQRFNESRPAYPRPKPWTAG